MTQYKKRKQYFLTKRRAAMAKCLEYKGGKCEICGYNRCTDALEFHHIFADSKEFGIATNLYASWDRLAKELDKCRLLCSNCHRELHARHIT